MILNLATVIPIVADAVIPALLGDAVLSSFGIRRFAVLHFLLALISLALAMVHLVLLHRTQPSHSGTLVADGFAAISHVFAQRFGPHRLGFVIANAGLLLGLDSSRQLELLRFGFYSRTY